MIKRIENGLFITLEGGEGSGKSTLINSLKNHYVKKGYIVQTTREPGGTKIAEDIRNIVVNNSLDATTQLFLFSACRKINIEEKIKPALKNGYIVISDRFVLSTIVYQGIIGKIPMDSVNAIIKLATDSVKPDMQILLDIPAEVGLGRIISNNRETNVFDKKGIEYHNKINEAYRSCNPDYVIDASKSEDIVRGKAIYMIDSYLSNDKKISCTNL